MSSDNIPLRTQIALNTFRSWRHNQADQHVLEYLMWECTLRCNLNCRHCGSDCRLDSATPDMPREQFLTVLHHIAEHQDPANIMVGLTGGEPLMRKDLAQCGYEISQLGFRWGMVSNGLALDYQRFQELMDAGLGSLSISLDGNETMHNWLRCNQLAYSGAMRAIKNAICEPRLSLDVITCVHRYNLSGLKDLCNCLIEMGVHFWRIFTIIPRGRAENSDDLSLQAEELKQLFDFIEITRQKGQIHLNYSCEGFLGAREGKVRDQLFFCKAGINYASVMADGTISACPSIRGNFGQGNIRDNQFMDIWENGFQSMRDRSWAKTGICARCKSWKWCEGNGVHLREGPQDGGPLHCTWNLMQG